MGTRMTRIERIFTDYFRDISLGFGEVNFFGMDFIAIRQYYFERTEEPVFQNFTVGLS